jgi:hypothetical protein
VSGTQSGSDFDDAKARARQESKTEYSEVLELGSRVMPAPVLTRWTNAFQLGSTAQAAVPGLYAWFVTVVPCAWSRGSHFPGKLASILALASLAVAIYLEPQRPKIARAVSVWGLTGGSIVVWMLSSVQLAPQHFATARALSGMLGWGLFAYASAAPALGPRTGGVVESGLLKPRSTVLRGDGWYLAGGIIAALLFQTIGWRVLSPERGLLVRIATLAAGIGVIGASVSLSLARRLGTKKSLKKNPMRELLGWGIAIAALLAIGMVYALLR